MLGYVMANKRFIFGLGLTLLLCGCGGDGDEMSLTDYVDRVNAIAERASQQGAELIAEQAQVEDFTPQHLQAGLERGLREIRIPLQADADAIEPPEQVAELHHLMWGWHARFLPIEEALAARAATAADTAADWEALSDSPEMAAYRAAIAEGKQVCTDFQAKLDATADRGTFADTPWIPGEMKEVVEAVLGCAWFPENPEDVYRYPPATSAP
jgi:hypothetical protein